jgi:hypothetical protein
MSENTLNMLMKAYRPIPISDRSKEVVDSITQYHDKFMKLINASSKDCGIYPER